jgi:hypothetical protein
MTRMTWGVFSGALLYVPRANYHHHLRVNRAFAATASAFIQSNQYSKPYLRPMAFDYFITPGNEARGNKINHIAACRQNPLC